MEKIHGHDQKDFSRGSRTPVDNWRRHYRHCYRILIVLMALSGCSTGAIKSSLLTGAATSAAVGVTSMVAPGVVIPSVVGGSTAALASAITTPKSEPTNVTAETVVNKAPDNMWSLLQKLTEIGGIGLLLFIGATYLLPLILGYLIPNGFERKKKK